jgi:hypothetical protein
MNTHYEDFTLELTERYMQRSLAYGMFPGFFSENASTGCYFENPKWYEPARPLFKKYVPLIQTIAKAGWQPVAFAKTNDPMVYIERFGEPEAGTVYFTVLNDSTQSRTVSIEIDATAMGWTGRNVSTVEMISGKEVPCEADRIKLDLNPEQAILLSLTPLSPSSETK